MKATIRPNAAMFLIYNILLTSVVFLGLPVFLVRILVMKKYRKSYAQRMGN